jgi:acyl-CoA synthetase (NDP forming)
VSVDITPAKAVVQRIDERDHFAALASLRPILAPSSVAVIGAADTPGNVGRALVENIRNDGFGGAVEWVGVSVLVGAVADPDLGPVLAVGLGGRQAGLGRSTAFRLLPLTDADADELIDASGSVAAELDGFRGSEPLDRQALRDLILRLALLLRTVPEVVEADLNPTRCTATGCVVLDTRVRIERRGPIERVKTW